MTYSWLEMQNILSLFYNEQQYEQRNSENSTLNNLLTFNCPIRFGFKSFEDNENAFISVSSIQFL